MGEGRALYVFVEIDIDVEHLTQSIIHNFKDDKEPLILLGTI